MQGVIPVLCEDIPVSGRSEAKLLVLETQNDSLFLSLFTILSEGIIVTPHCLIFLSNIDVW